MNEREFCYWLQGFFEIQGTSAITKEQAELINEHLQLVFKKVTGDNTSEVGALKERIKDLEFLLSLKEKDNTSGPLIPQEPYTPFKWRDPNPFNNQPICSAL